MTQPSKASCYHTSVLCYVIRALERCCCKPERKHSYVENKTIEVSVARFEQPAMPALTPTQLPYETIIEPAHHRNRTWQVNSSGHIRYDFPTPP